MARQLKLNLGGIVFSLESNGGPDLTVSPDCKAFLTSEGEPDVVLRASFGVLPAVALEEEVFHTDGLWSLYRSQGKLVFHFWSRDLESTPHKLAVIEPDFGAGDIYTRIRESEQEGCFNPLNYPLDELLVLSVLSRDRGMVVHACAVDYRGQGWLFLGTSGAGKTTLANLWREESGVTLLSDDRVIIRDMGDSYRIYGTPWHGTAGIALPQSVPLSRIFFLAHDHENRLTPVQHADAASRILVRCFPTFWDAEGMNYTLGLCERLSARIPSHELGFVPDKRVIEMLKSLA